MEKTYKSIQDHGWIKYHGWFIAVDAFGENGENDFKFFPGFRPGMYQLRNITLEDLKKFIDSLDES